MPAKRVLIVVSSYRPVMLADMHRARMLSWELPKLGWDVEVLTPSASEVRQDAIETQPAGFFPEETPVHEVGSLARKFFAACGSQSPTLRTWMPMDWAGRRLLSKRCFDLVYFSTTTYTFFCLGPRWKGRVNIPYVLDFHDPWVKTANPAAAPEDWKGRLARRAAKWMERVSVANAAGLVAVSPQYVTTLRQRYEHTKPAWFAPGRNAVIPFGALESDLIEAAKNTGRLPREYSGEITIHYIGAGGPIMARSFTLICRILAKLRSKGNPQVNRVRIRLLGTTYNWKPGDKKFLEEIARDAGVGDLVDEDPRRVSYRRSLELLLESDGALILGVDDEGYMPSKLFSYALSGKPLLAAVRRDSPAFGEFEHTPQLGHALWFDAEKEMPWEQASQIVQEFLQEAAGRKRFDRQAVLEPFLAGAMAKRHAELFEKCLKQDAEIGKTEIRN